MRNLKMALMILVALVVLQGCPSGDNVTPNGTGKNTIVFHNQHSKNVEELSVDKTGPVPGEEPAAKGINLLAEPLEPGETFTVSNLDDGKYSLTAKYRQRERISGSGSSAVYDENYCCGLYGVSQVFEGGKTYNWYFDPERNDKGAIEVAEEEGCCLLKCVFGN